MDGNRPARFNLAASNAKIAHDSLITMITIDAHHIE